MNGIGGAFLLLPQLLGELRELLVYALPLMENLLSVKPDGGVEAGAVGVRRRGPPGHVAYAPLDAPARLKP